MSPGYMTFRVSNFTNQKMYTMKKLMSISLLALSLSLISGSCQKESEQAVSPVAKNQERLEAAKNIASYLSQPSVKKNGSNNGNGAVFLIPDGNYLSWGVFKDVVFDPVTFNYVSGEIGFVGAEYGANDFWNQLPDGRIHIHLVSNSADASYSDLVSGIDYEGTGTCNFNYAGRFDTVNVPFPPFQFIFLAPDSVQAVSAHGQANVVEVGQSGPNRKMKLKVLTTPSGNNNTTLSLK